MSLLELGGNECDEFNFMNFQNWQFKKLVKIREF